MLGYELNLRLGLPVPCPTSPMGGHIVVATLGTLILALNDKIGMGKRPPEVGHGPAIVIRSNRQ